MRISKGFRTLGISESAGHETSESLKLLLFRDCERERLRLTGGEDIAASLERVMATGDLMHLVDSRPDRHVNVFSAVVEGLTREWHPVLPAYEPTDTGNRSFFAECENSPGRLCGLAADF